MDRDSRVTGLDGIDFGARLLESRWVRLVLSFLIVLSVIPERTFTPALPAWLAAAVPYLFLAVFVPELILRFAVWVRRQRAGLGAWSEVILLALDVLAVLSFLPLQHVVQDLAFLRLLRLGRMLLLFGYVFAGPTPADPAHEGGRSGRFGRRGPGPASGHVARILRRRS